ncbi:hypothetical protein GW17_00038254 [Ensete ventricosum]|nr:hypothetical protein GW17_00038254 [Ensete ventricosum]
MKAAGRKNIRRASKEDGLSLREGQGIMRVVSLRGSNVIEVGSWMPKVLNLLLYFQPNFRRAFGLKQVFKHVELPPYMTLDRFHHSGSFVVVDESGREKALESGSKIACMVSQVLFHDQVRALEKSLDW